MQIACNCEILQIRFQEWPKICGELLTMISELVDKKSLQEKHISLIIVSFSKLTLLFNRNLEMLHVYN